MYLLETTMERQDSVYPSVLTIEAGSRSFTSGVSRYQRVGMHVDHTRDEGVPFCAIEGFSIEFSGPNGILLYYPLMYMLFYLH